MFNVHSTDHLTKSELFRELELQTKGLLDSETDAIANAANLSGLLYHSLPDINWVGFYFHRGGELLVGPFQGKPACVHIAMGQGVCGTAAKQQQTVIVGNVHEFPGHIACDSASNSEIVIPLVREGRVLGVLDIDSPLFNRFDETDQKGLESITAIFMKYTTVWPD